MQSGLLGHLGAPVIKTAEEETEKEPGYARLLNMVVEIHAAAAFDSHRMRNATVKDVYVG